MKKANITVKDVGRMIALRQRYDLDRIVDREGRRIIWAMAWVESNWRPDALRFEPAFKRQYIDPLNDEMVLGHLHVYDPKFLAEERLYQACSFGLMQVMLRTAREMGFDGRYLDLIQPDINMHYGYRYLKQKRLQTKHMTIRDPVTGLLQSDAYAVLGYNMGSPPLDRYYREFPYWQKFAGAYLSLADWEV